MAIMSSGSSGCGTATSATSPRLRAAGRAAAGAEFRLRDLWLLQQPRQDRRGEHSAVEHPAARPGRPPAAAADIRARGAAREGADHRPLRGPWGQAGPVDPSPASPHPQLLDSYNAVDIALDPLAYSGGLTTLEALWMGVPVITLPGDRFCTRHSLAHLTAAGLTGLVAEDASSYLDAGRRSGRRPGPAVQPAVEAAGADGRVAPVRCGGIHADAGSGLSPDVAGPVRLFIIPPLNHNWLTVVA